MPKTVRREMGVGVEHQLDSSPEKLTFTAESSTGPGESQPLKPWVKYETNPSLWGYASISSFDVMLS